jgi:putative transposase
LTICRRCELLDEGRWTAYAKPAPPNRKQRAWEETVMRRLDYWHSVDPCRGVRGLRKLLRNEDGLYAGRKLIARLMYDMGIAAVYPKPNLSKPGKEHNKFPYLLKNKTISHPNQVWAIDITYIPVGHSHMYLTAIIDWSTRFIVGWELADTLETVSCPPCQDTF